MTTRSRYDQEIMRPLQDGPQHRERSLELVLKDPAALATIPQWAIRRRAVALPETVTALPTDPVEGDEILYRAENRAWHFAYLPDGSSYPWYLIDGAPLRAENAGTSMSYTSGSYGDPATPGPTITGPLAGDYRVEWFFQGQHSVGAGLGWMAIKNGSAATADANGIRGQAAAANHDILAPVGSQEITVAAAGDVLLAQYKNPSGGTLTINNHGGINPWMTAIPIRVGRT